MFHPHGLQPGSVFAGDFRIERALAMGGMGAVYVAEQLSTGRRRALKLLLPSLVDSERSRERFEQEARVASRIASDHVVEVVSAGVDPGTGAPWLAMELLEGETLAQRVERSGPLGPAETLEVMRQLCHALVAPRTHKAFSGCATVRSTEHPWGKGPAETKSFSFGF
ncbi:MAG: hypothetical protein HYZ29_03360 [Myxococcales bacterium]|nr:hypothetical protein [Myxococcales bacterium]